MLRPKHAVNAALLATAIALVVSSTVSAAPRIVLFEEATNYA